MVGNVKIKEIISNAKDRASDVYVWYLFQHSFIKSKLKILTYKNDRSQIIFQVDSQSEHYVAQMISGNGFMNICIPDQGVSFQSELIEYGKDGVMKVKYPTVINQWDRRGAPRIDALGIIKISIQIEKHTINKDCYDISSGGLSLILTKHEAIYFSNGKNKIIKADLKLNNCVHKILLEIVSTEKLAPYRYEKSPYGFLKVSFRVLDSSAEYIKDIEELITEYRKLDHNAS